MGGHDYNHDQGDRPSKRRRLSENEHDAPKRSRPIGPAARPNEDSALEVDYTIGDSGSQWRMTKLRAVYNQAKDRKVALETVAIERYDTLRDFDLAREEEVELDRRKRFGRDYVGKDKPNGDLHQERLLAEGERRSKQASRSRIDRLNLPQQNAHSDPPAQTTVSSDPTTLNKLRAEMLKAKMRRAPNAAALEAEYEAAVRAKPQQPGVVVLGAEHSRELAGELRNKAKPASGRRAAERGQLQENQEMTIEDMVREERRTKGSANNESARIAETIAKDSRFETDLDYQDENANKLARRIHKSEINLRNTAVSDFRKVNKALDRCQLCRHDESDRPPEAPVIALATRTFLTLPTIPELTDGGAVIVPIQHRANLLECDEDEWEEVRNFMKSLTRMYHDEGRDVIFYENAAQPHRYRHAAMQVIPLPYSMGETAPAFFKEAIISSDEEWAQHRKLIDTLAKARKEGMGRSAFRRSIAKQMPYFHVWFELDGGLGHVIEDEGRWPKGDLFAREIVGGMLDVTPDVIRKQGRWHPEDERVRRFTKQWRKFDWTRVLVEGQ